MKKKRGVRVQIETPSGNSAAVHLNQPLEDTDPKLIEALGELADRAADYIRKQHEEERKTMPKAITLEQAGDEWTVTCALCSRTWRFHGEDRARNYVYLHARRHVEGESG